MNHRNTTIDVNIYTTPFVIPEESEKVSLFDIAFFSKHDGPGIRTVVYFQGCNARCDWCHSPHSQPRHSPLVYNFNVCTGCQRCISCVNKVHSFHAEEHRIDRTDCTLCGKCVEKCPQSMKELKGSALHLPTTTLSVKSLFDQIATSIRLGGKNGGVTLSGGEALLQHQAAKELLIYCKQQGFHTAVETSGLLSPDIYLDVAPWVDLWLFGMRIITGKEHPRHDVHIDEVLGKLNAVKAKILPRIPMVPGFFDQPDILESIVHLLKKWDIDTVCLNPWNIHYEVNYLRGGISLRMSAPTTDEIVSCENELKTTFTHFKFNIYENI